MLYLMNELKPGTTATSLAEDDESVVQRHLQESYGQLLVPDQGLASSIIGRDHLEHSGKK